MCWCDADLNVPLDDDRQHHRRGRIIASVPTLKALADAGAKVVVTAHLGRPKGEPGSEVLAGPGCRAGWPSSSARHVQLRR